MKILFSANYYLSSYLLTFILSLANILESSHGPIHTPTASFFPPLYVAQNTLSHCCFSPGSHPSPLEISFCCPHKTERF